MEDLRNLAAITDLINQEKWEAIETYFNNSQQLKHFGITINLNDISRPKCEINEIQPYHLGGIGQDFINGGIISAVVDLSVGLTGLTFLGNGNLATSRLSLNLKKPIINKRFYAVSMIEKRTGNKVFSQATLYNYKNEPCVFATGIVQINLERATAKP